MRKERDESHEWVLCCRGIGGGGADLLSPSSSLEPPPDDAGDGLSDGDVTEDLTLCSTSTSRPLSFRQTLPTASWGGKGGERQETEGKARAKLGRWRKNLP